MSEVPTPRTYGGYFQLEATLLGQYLATLEGPRLDHKEDIDAMVLELELENPYIGRELLLITEAPVKVVNQRLKTVRYLEPGEVNCRIECFFPYYEDVVEPDSIDAVAGAILGFTDGDEVGYIDLEKICDVYLKGAQNPFSVDIDQFEQLQISLAESNLSKEKRAEVLENFTRTRLNPSSWLKNCTLDLLFCDPASMTFIRDDDSGAALTGASEAETENDFAEGIMFRGAIENARFLRYEVQSNADESGYLMVALSLPEGHWVRQAYGATKILMDPYELSSGTIRGGSPPLN